jgi:hypothetical protein
LLVVKGNETDSSGHSTIGKGGYRNTHDAKHMGYAVGDERFGGEGVAVDEGL